MEILLQALCAQRSQLSQETACWFFLTSFRQTVQRYLPAYSFGEILGKHDKSFLLIKVLFIKHFSSFLGVFWPEKRVETEECDVVFSVLLVFGFWGVFVTFPGSTISSIWLGALRYYGEEDRAWGVSRVQFIYCMV